jgi:hypothetical protein
MSNFQVIPPNDADQISRDAADAHRKLMDKHKAREQRIQDQHHRSMHEFMVRMAARRDNAGTRQAPPQSPTTPAPRTYSYQGVDSFKPHPSSSLVRDELAAFGRPVSQTVKDAIAKGSYWSGLPPEVPVWMTSIMDHQERERNG